jgi:AbrB family looped-hinge helix DNA binding protein
MHTTIDPAGRVVIPKSIRDSLGLRGGEELEIAERDGRIEIEVASTPVRMVKKGRGLVAVPERELPPLTDDIVRATLDRMRR